MLAAVEDVHQRGRQNSRLDAAQIAPQRQAHRVRGSTCGRHGYGQDGVRAHLGFILGAVHLQHAGIDGGLIEGRESAERGPQLVVDIGDRGKNALAAEAASVVVAQFDGFMGTSRRAARNRGATGAADRFDLSLNGWVSSGIQDFSGRYLNDLGHGCAADITDDRQRRALLNAQKLRRKANSRESPPADRRLAQGGAHSAIPAQACDSEKRRTRSGSR